MKDLNRSLDELITEKRNSKKNKDDFEELQARNIELDVKLANNNVTIYNNLINLY
jgi:hypothetical protein